MDILSSPRSARSGLSEYYDEEYARRGILSDTDSDDGSRLSSPRRSPSPRRYGSPAGASRSLPPPAARAPLSL